jgi:hypothetical protein
MSSFESDLIKFDTFINCFIIGMVLFTIPIRNGIRERTLLKEICSLNINLINGVIENGR